MITDPKAEHQLQNLLKDFSRKLKYTAGALSLATLISCGSQNKVEMPLVEDQSRPNILFMMAEDMSLRVGAFGDEAAHTPHLDALAEDSVLYPNAFTTAGVCSPSRAGLITGVYQNSFGASGMRTSSYPDGEYRTVPPEEIKAFPELLRAEGYYTFTNDKLDYQFSGSLSGSGPFTIWDDEKALKSLWRPNRERKNFFGLVNFFVTHETMMFPRNQLPKGLVQLYMRFKFRGIEEVVFPEDVEVPPYYPDTPVVRQQIAQHYNNIAYMDQQVGEILEKLEDDGLAENTIVIWTTDHGDCLPRAKRELYDSGLKVPVMIRWPEKFRPADARPGEIDERLISFVDLGPTILSMAGVEIPDFMHGQIVLGDDAENRDMIFAAKDRIDAHEDMQRAVRDDRYLYLYNGRNGVPGAYHLKFRDNLEIMQELWKYDEEGLLEGVQTNWFDPRPEEELYDTWSDPHQIHNLADDPSYADELSRLRRELADWQDEVGDLTADTPESVLKERFWPGGEQPLTPAPEISLIPGELSMTVSIANSAAGASIGYQIKGVDSKKEWRLYTGPFEVPEGSEIKAKAVRYGWKESESVSIAAEK